MRDKNLRDMREEQKYLINQGQQEDDWLLRAKQRGRVLEGWEESCEKGGSGAKQLRALIKKRSIDMHVVSRERCKKWLNEEKQTSEGTGGLVRYGAVVFSSLPFKEEDE